jgi:hypothetical protein
MQAAAIAAAPAEKFFSSTGTMKPSTIRETPPAPPKYGTHKPAYLPVGTRFSGEANFSFRPRACVGVRWVLGACCVGAHDRVLGAGEART